MKTKITGLLTFLIGTFFFYSCDTDVEALEIQKLKTYDEQYFENLRAFKKSDHEISYAYTDSRDTSDSICGYAILPAEIGYTFCHACRCFSLQTPVYR